MRWSSNPVVVRVYDSRLVLNNMEGISVTLLVVGGVFVRKVSEPAMQSDYAAWLDL